MKKIIIADHLRPLIGESVLKRAHFKVFTVRSADEAYGIHKTEKVNLIIADSDLPGISEDRFRTIRNNHSLKKVSILVLCSQEEASALSCSGANIVMKRPVDPEVLSEKLNQLLNVHERMDMRAKIKITVKGNFANEHFICNTLNISASGILIETGKLLSKGNIITCSFAVPDFGIIVSDGEVTRVVRHKNGKHQYGIRFIDMAGELKSVIDKYIRQLSRKRREAVAS